MDTTRIVAYLKSAGFNEVSVDGDYVKVEDPSCILRGFETFLDYAWIAIYIITGLLLVGWALSKIFGAKDDIFTNMKNLMMVFIVLSVIKPVLNIIYGSNLFGIGCRTITISILDVENFISARQKSLSLQKQNLYEDINIYDSGPTNVPESSE